MTEAGGDWYERWRRRQRGLLEDHSELRATLTPQAREILDEARRLAAGDDPERHAAIDVDGMVARVEALEADEPLRLHTPVSNALAMLRTFAQEVVAARAEAAPLPRLTGPTPVRTGRRPARLGFDWLLVVAGGHELSELVAECSPDAIGAQAIRTADTPGGALDVLRTSPDGTALVVVNLTLNSADGPGPHGLVVAKEARRRRHSVLLVTAASDYLHYHSQLQASDLTDHDVIVKTRHDFVERLRGRISELAQPAPVPISYDEEAGNVVRIGAVEVSDLEAQEALVLSVLDATWQSPSAIADACSYTDLAPSPSNVPSLMSTLRRKLRNALVRTESMYAQSEVIESKRLRDQPAQYRLAPWLHWIEAPEPVGAPRALPPVLVIEDQQDWADWVLACLEELRWPASAASTVEEARRALAAGDETPILVVDLGLPDPVTDIPDYRMGLGLIEDVAARRDDVRVIVLSWHGRRDSLRSRLFEAGVRTIDVIDKEADREELRAVLLASLQRAADESWRGVRRPRESHPAHTVVRLDHQLIEVDGHLVDSLSPREAAVMDLLISRPNQPVTAEYLEVQCYPQAATERKPLNKVHQTFKRLRDKIDRAVGHEGVGESVLRTPRRGARTTYGLYGAVTDHVNGAS